MQEQNDRRAEIVKVLMPLLLSYPKSGMTAENIAAYALALETVPVELLAAAVVKCLRKYTFFPAVAQIFEEVKSIYAEVKGTTAKTAADAWGEVEKEMRRTAFTEIKPHFSTQEIDQAANSMGWDSICRTLEKDMPILRAQFRTAYEQTLRKSQESAANKETLQALDAPTRERIQSAVSLALGEGKTKT